MKKKMRFLNLLVVLFVFFAGVYPAVAAPLAAKSQNLNIGGFPVWLQGTNGLALQGCFDRINCAEALPLAGEEPNFNPALALSFPTPLNFPSEFFYFLASSTLQVNGAAALVSIGIEGAFANGAPVAGDQEVFNSFVVRITNPPVTGIYTLLHPWGETTFAGQPCTAGLRCDLALTTNTGIQPEFTGLLGNSLNGSISNFLVQTDPPPPAGFLGNGLSAGPVTGSPLVPPRNSVSLRDPNGIIVGTGTEFALSGQTIGLDVTPGTNFNFGAATITAPPTATAPQMVTVTNTTADAINFLQLVTAGANANNFAVVAPDTCSNTTVAAGTSCSFNVTFTPVALAAPPVTAPRTATILLNPTTVQPVPPVTPVIPNPPAVTLSLSGTAQFPLAVTVTGTGLTDNLGAGSVSSAPAGINCSTTAVGVNCTAPFNAGSTVTLTPSASDSPLSLFDGWISDGTTNANDNNIIVTMGEAKAATASFIRAFTITTSADVNGTITAGSIVKQGTSPTLTLTPNTGFHFLSLTDSNVSVTGAAVPVDSTLSSAFTYMIPVISADHVVAAAFAVNNYLLTLTATANGTITGPADVNHFQTATFTITPTTGFLIDTLVDSGDAAAGPQSVQPGSLGTSTYTTTAITGDRTITVTFVIGQENITTSVSNGQGTIVADAAAVNFGSDSIITITPAPGYHIETLTDNGADAKASVTPGSAAGTFSYKITGVVIGHNVVVGLSNVLNLTSSAGTNGALVVPPTAIFGTTPSITATPKSRLFQVRDILKSNSALPFTRAANPGDAVTIALPAVTADSTVNATFMPSGDLNADGSLTVADAMKALRIVIGLQLASGDDAVAMDVAPLGNDNKPLGGNGTDMADVLVILKRVVNAITW